MQNTKMGDKKIENYTKNLLNDNIPINCIKSKYITNSDVIFIIENIWDLMNRQSSNDYAIDIDIFFDEIKMEIK